MATWIIHLRITEALLARLPGLDEEKFALGNVAPDSGKPDERWEVFTPSTQVTHFQDMDSPGRANADLEFYRRYLLPLREKNEDVGLFSFRLGFFFHLVTDNLWSLLIGKPTKQRFQAQFDADPDFIWEVKKDWYGLDFMYLRDAPKSLFWRVFRYAKPEQGGLDFLVPESLAWSVAHIQQYYQTIDEHVQDMYNRPYIYLSQAEADRFVQATVLLLERIYQYLWADGETGGAALSVLEIPACKEELSWQKTNVI